MKVDELALKLNARLLTGKQGTEKEVTSMYACDLLSWVMSHAKKGDAWVTVHTHINIVAVAVLNELSCIILPEDIRIEESTLKKAAEEGVPVLSTSMDCFGICGQAYGLFDRI